MHYSGFHNIFPSRQTLESQRNLSENFKIQPMISIIIPTFNTSPLVLRECILSVLNQSYKNFEICIADDCSSEDTVLELKKLANESGRIKVIYRKKRGQISTASNDALSLVSGEYVGLLDHDDILWPNALYEVVKVLNERPQLLLIYTDEDQMSMNGKVHLEPMVKPKWNFHFLRATNYIGHFLVIKKTLIRSLGGFRKGYDGAQDYDLLLRATQCIKNDSDRIYHIPKILYSWRRSNVSTAKNISVNKQLAKKYAIFAQKKSLEDDLLNSGLKGEIVRSDRLGYWRVNLINEH